MYNNFGGLDHLEAIRGRFGKLEAVMKVSLTIMCGVIKRCGIKNVYRMYNNFGGLAHLEAIRGCF